MGWSKGTAAELKQLTAQSMEAYTGNVDDVSLHAHLPLNFNTVELLLCTSAMLGCAFSCMLCVDTPAQLTGTVRTLGQR